MKAVLSQSQIMETSPRSVPISRTVVIRIALAILTSVLPAGFAFGADTTGPKLVSIDFTPKSVDVSSASQTVTVTARWSDDSSGFSWGTAHFNSPYGYQVQDAYFDSSNRISGTVQDGVYRTTVIIRQNSQGGNWFLACVEGHDFARNFSHYGSGCWQESLPYPAGAATVLAVKSPYPITEDRPATYHYRGYVTGVSPQPLGVKVGDPFDMELSLFPIDDGYVTGEGSGTLGASWFNTGYSDYTAANVSNGSPDTFLLDAQEGHSAFFYEASVGVQLKDPSGDAVAGTGPYEMFSSLRSGDWPFLSLGQSCYGGGCDDALNGVTAKVRGSFPLETELLTVSQKTLPPAGVSTAQWSGIFDSYLASNRTGTYFNANAAGQYITYTVSVLRKGIYRVLVGVQTKANKGKFQLTIDGVKQGQVQDEYSSTVGYSYRELGTVAFSTAGNKAFTFTVTGRNANSTGYTLAFDYVHLVPTLREETESLKVQSITPSPSGYTSAGWHGVFNAAAASGGAGTYFNSNAAGNYITYTVPVVKAGTYRVRVGVQTKPNKGKFQLAINGLNVGQPQDEYDPSVTYGVRDLGMVTFSASGNYAFKFTVTGKNASSTGYTLAFDYIDLVP